MKTKLNGRTYNCGTAKLIKKFEEEDVYLTDSRYYFIGIYKTRSNRVFAHCWGGAMSPFTHKIDSNSWCGGEFVYDLTDLLKIDEFDLEDVMLQIERIRNDICFGDEHFGYFTQKNFKQTYISFREKEIF